MQLGQDNLTTGDTRRYQVDYRPFLQFGEVLIAATVTGNGPTSTVKLPTTGFLDVTETQLYFFVTGGSVGENFTASVQVKTSYGQIVNDTVAYSVVSP